jgi:hypothetical protein
MSGAQKSCQHSYEKFMSDMGRMGVHLCWGEPEKRLPKVRPNKALRKRFQKVASTHPTGKDGHHGWAHCFCNLASQIRELSKEIFGE